MLCLVAWGPESVWELAQWFRLFGLWNAWGGPTLLRLCASTPVISAAFFILSVGCPFSPCSIHMSSIPCLLISSYAWDGKHMGFVLNQITAEAFIRVYWLLNRTLHRCIYNTEEEPLGSNHRESNTLGQLLLLIGSNESLVVTSQFSSILVWFGSWFTQPFPHTMVWTLRHAFHVHSSLTIQKCILTLSYPLETELFSFFCFTATHKQDMMGQIWKGYKFQHGLHM